MKVIVFGATGTIGALAVEELLIHGHQVTAFARAPEKLKIPHENLTLAKGNALSEADVSKAIKGHEAVVVALGSGMSRTSRVRSKGTLNVIHGMQMHGVTRLICQSTLGTFETRANLNFFWKHVMFGALLRPVYRDHELQETLVRASGLDWTIVRPSAFADGPAKGEFKVDFAPTERRLALNISRADVAAFLARQLSDLSFRHRAVSISN